MMTHKLTELYNENAWVCLYHNPSDHNAFMFGRLLRVNESYIALLSVTPFGRYDGISVVQTRDIFRVEYNNQYEKSILQRMDWEDSPWHPVIDEDIVRSLLSEAKSGCKVVSIELCESGINDIVGFVEKVEENVFSVRQVDSYGCSDGISVARIEDISLISCDAEEERMIQYAFSKTDCQRN